MKREVKSTGVVLLVVTLMIITTGGTSIGVLYSASKSFENNQLTSSGTVTVTLPIGSYAMTTEKGCTELVVEDFGHLRVPGAPALPSKIFSIAIPPGAEATSVTYTTAHAEAISIPLSVAPAAPARLLSDQATQYNEQQQQRYTETYQAIYGSDESYPVQQAEFVRSAGYRKYNLVDVSVTPFSYQPLSGQLTYYPEITVSVQYTIGPSSLQSISDSIDSTEHVAHDLIVNYEQAQSWYAPARTTGDRGYSFVVITLDSLTSAVSPLVSWEWIKEKTAKVVTTSWIDANYQGMDLSEKIRNFLREKYPSEQWGITDVLFVGHYDDVPMRTTWQDLGYGKPETDLYYAELTKSDNESWDKNQNQRYGETFGDSIDFYSEVNVGRIPWSEPDIVQHICEKSVAYEQNDDPAYKKNMLLLGAYFWEDTDNAHLMEAKVNQSWMADWTLTRMYEKNEDFWSDFTCEYPLLEENVMSVWPDGQFSFVNWAGHGSPVSSHIYGLGQPPFITSYDCEQLNDAYPAIVFADACSNSDTGYVNIGQAMLRQGAVGFVGATQVALGMPAWEDPMDGSSQSLDYYFTTAVTSGEYTQGAALQYALQQMYTNHLWDERNYEMFEWGSLWGNPDLSMNAITEFPCLEINSVEAGRGLQAVVKNVGTLPGENLVWTISIQGGLLRRIDTTVTGEIPSVGINEEYTIDSGTLTKWNLGFAEITVQAFNAYKTYTAVVFGPFLLRLTETA